MEGKWELQLPSFCAPLTCTDLLVEGKWATSGGGERSDKFCVTADVPLSFKSDMWNHFIWSRNEKVTDRQTRNKRNSDQAAFTPNLAGRVVRRSCSGRRGSGVINTMTPSV